METRTAPALVGDRYRLEGLLGEGGMARVFAAFDERLERPVAVKILRTETQSIAGMRQRFQQEALIAARLIHPHIVAVLDFGEQPPTSYLVMERLPGSTLRDEIVTRGPLPPSRVALVMAETLWGLSAAHRCGVLHRDIKPSNILLQQDGHTKITDFGIAKSFDIGNDPERMTDEMTVAGFVLGTPGYLAPERQSGCPATVQSDLYAVGAVMVEALTGQRLDPGAVPYEQLPPPLRDVARRAMAPDPRDRFTSAQEMLQAMRDRPARVAAARVPTAPSPSASTAAVPMGPVAEAGGTAALAAPPRPGPPRRRRRSRWRRMCVAAIAVLALAAVGVVWLAPSDPPTGTAAPPAQHGASHPRTQNLTRTTAQPGDAEGSALKTLATSLANGALPGDGALAAALLAVAAQQPGTDRQTSAQQVLSLAQVLLDGGGISTGQYQDVAGALQATGATVTTTTTTTTTAAPPALPGPSFLGHGHGHERGDGQGFNG